MHEQRQRETLKRWERLRQSSQFQTCFKRGSRIHLPGMLVVMAPNGLGVRRMGLSVGRRFGNSVKRNRAKRIIRELFRRNKPLFPNGHDFVFIPKEDFFYYSWNEHIQHLRDAFCT